MAEPLQRKAGKNVEENVNSTESVKYGFRKNGVRQFPGWIKVTAVAAASVLAGGLAAAWIYRKSIARLQNPEEVPEYSNFHISEGEMDDEI